LTLDPENNYTPKKTFDGLLMYNTYLSVETWINLERIYRMDV